MEGLVVSLKLPSPPAWPCVSGRREYVGVSRQWGFARCRMFHWCRPLVSTCGQEASNRGCVGQYFTASVKYLMMICYPPFRFSAGHLEAGSAMEASLEQTNARSAEGLRKGVGWETSERVAHFSYINIVSQSVQYSYGCISSLIHPLIKCNKGLPEL